MITADDGRLSVGEGAAEGTETETESGTCLCFVCDCDCGGGGGGGGGVRLQYGRTSHSNTGLPIKLGQLIGDEFMVIVSVDDRLCFACIKLINLADKLELQLNTVKRVITQHLKTKYQLLDNNENDIDNTKCASNSTSRDHLTCDNVRARSPDVEFTLPSDLENEMVSSVSSSIDKPNDQPQWEGPQSDGESDVEFVEMSDSKCGREESVERKDESLVAFSNGLVSVSVSSSNVGVYNMNQNQLVATKNSRPSRSEGGEETRAATSDGGGGGAGEKKKVELNCGRPMFSCQMCQGEFHTQIVLRRHMMSKHLNRWSCYFCGDTFADDGDYQKHMQTHVNVNTHTQPTAVVDHLIQLTPSVSEKQNGIKTFYKCKNCKFKTRFNYLLDKHVSECCSNGVTDSSNNSRCLKCLTCGNCFKTQTLLSLHVCKTVPVTFPHPLSGDSNISSSVGGGGGDGNVCSNIVVGEKCLKYECGICSMTFVMKNNLIAHLKSHKVSDGVGVGVGVGVALSDGRVKGEKSEVEDNVPATISDEECRSPGICCSQCSSTFDKHSLLMEHLNKEHSKCARDDDDVNTAEKEMYFGNVEHFMALPTSTTVDDEAEAVTVTSTLGPQENKTHIITINDLINSEPHLFCDKCNMSFNCRSDFDRHSVLVDHKHFQYRNVMKVDDLNTQTGDDYSDECNKERSHLSCEVVVGSLGSIENGKSSVGAEEMGMEPVDDEECMVACNICNEYVKRKLIDAHYGSNHENICCNYCSFETKNNRLMRRHIKEHNDKTSNSRKEKQQCRNYLCQLCSETFKSKRSLQVHEESHPENFQFNCEKCSKRFMKERQLKRHHDQVHRDPHCYYCGKEILNVKALKSHEQRHVRELHNSKQLECDICKRVFKTRTGLRHHFATHTGKFKYLCEYCQRGFMSRMMLEEHKSRHTKEERYVCDVCGRKFTFQSTYWIHRKWHDNPFPYKCNFCGRLFRHTSLLAVHKRKHTGERPYKCPHCPLTFTVGGTLKRHLILHTQKFPFTCAACNRGFTTKHKYSMHLAKTHNDYHLLNDKKSNHQETDFKMVVKETPPPTMPPIDAAASQPTDTPFQLMPDTSFALVSMEEEEEPQTGNSAVMMPCIMAVNNEENSGLVFEIISAGSPLQPINNSISISESAILPDMWCE